MRNYFTNIFNNKWSIPFIFILLFIFILSIRLLSDPDLGFHLNAGKFIVENVTFPDKDTFTYTSTQNDYIDLHWLFQVVIFCVFKIASYEGLSILVMLLSLTLGYLLLLRNKRLKIPLGISCLLIFISYLIIESRIVLRPELFTYIFITLILLLLDLYYHHKKRNLYFLPVIMLLWCNMHSLFILGFILFGAYFTGIWLRDKKFDKYLFSWLFASFLICFFNPYFIKGFVFPLELFTRFDSHNVFNQHIDELKSSFETNFSELKNILFFIFLCIFVILFIYNIRKRKFHEFIIIPAFAYLALVSIRNYPLFIITSLPVFSSILFSIKDKIKEKKFYKPLVLIIYFSLFILPIGLYFRLFTNSFYISNNSPFKTNFGIDPVQQPVDATEFLSSHKLKGKIMNSLGFGGWISWSLQQPVFIDGRLEVVKEDLYTEVVNSWNGGLKKLIEKYNPSILIYNYSKYHPWTEQLNKMPEWRLVYLDGLAAIFLQKNYCPDIPELNPSYLFAKNHINFSYSETEKQSIINTPLKSTFTQWLEGFHKKTNYNETSLLNMGSFYLQRNQLSAAESFFIEDYKICSGKNTSILYALSDIYIKLKNKKLAQLCLTNLIKYEPDNKQASITLKNIEQVISVPADSTFLKPNEKDAVFYFNEGNSKYKMKDINGALNDYNKAIELNPDYYKAYNNRGILNASELNNLNDALKDFDKAIEINPEYGDAFLGRGSVKYSLKDYSGACSDWEAAYNKGVHQAYQQIELYCNKKTH